MFTFKESTIWGVCITVIATWLVVPCWFGYIKEKRMENWYAREQNKVFEYMNKLGIPHKHDICDDKGNMGYIVCNSKECKWIVQEYTWWEKILNICLTD